MLPFASHRDLYLLVAGVVLGILIGPAVLGRAAPQWYDRVFVGGGEVAAELEAAEAALSEELRRLEASGVSGVALREHENQAMQQMLPLHVREAAQRAQREGELMGWMTALIVATLIVMVLESLISPRPMTGGSPRAVVTPAVGRLITVRYALLAVWIILALARPALLQNLPVIFTVLLVAVAMAAAFIPLGPGRKSPAVNANEHGWE